MRDGKILDPEKLFFDEKGFADKKIDCDNRIIAPGFIDVQINGKTLLLSQNNSYFCSPEKNHASLHLLHYSIHTIY